MPRIAICAALLIVSVAWLSADQGPPAAPREPSFYTGKWELAVGQFPTNGPFDRILELTVDGTKATGTLTTGTRTVKVAGQIDKGFYLRTEAGTGAPQSELETFVGAAWDGTFLHGSYFRGIGNAAPLTGWVARRPTGK